LYSFSIPHQGALEGIVLRMVFSPIYQLFIHRLLALVKLFVRYDGSYPEGDTCMIRAEYGS